jgi:integrase
MIRWGQDSGRLFPRGLQVCFWKASPIGNDKCPDGQETHEWLTLLPRIEGGRRDGTRSQIDLRRTCARLCHQAGGELEQIQFLLGHASVETTERYLGCKQHFQNAVNDAIGLEPGGS